MFPGIYFPLGTRTKWGGDREKHRLGSSERLSVDPRSGLRYPRDKEVPMIRPFSPSDLESLLQIENQSFPKSPYDRATFRNLYILYSETFLVYVGPSLRPNAAERGHASHDREEDRISGYIIFSPEGHIISIAVHPRYRRKGIGKELLQKAMNVSRPKKVWAEVRRSNRGAQTFYSSIGFRMNGMVPNYYGTEDALIMEWSCNPS